MIGLFYGLALTLLGISWIYNSISTYSSASTEEAAAITFGFCLLLSLFYALLGYVFCWINFTYKNTFTESFSSVYLRVLSFAAIWTALELLRSYTYIGFPWLLLGAAAIETPLAPFAPIGGSFTLSFLICLIAASLLYIVKFIPSIYVWRNQVKMFGLLVVVGGTIASGYYLSFINWTENLGPPIKVAVVQGNIKQEHKWNSLYAPRIFATYEDATIANLDKSLIVWPEAATPYTYPSEGQERHAGINRLLNDQGVKLIYGGLREAVVGRKIYNSIFIAGDAGDNEQAILPRKVYDKNILVPFGEFIPLADRFPQLFKNMDLSAFLTKRGKEAKAFQLGEWMVAPSICYEVAYGSYIAAMAKDSNFLVSVSNDAWFGDSLGPHQHMHWARMRALENQQYMLRASNNGVTAIADPQGRIISQAEQFRFAILQEEIYARQGNTPYQGFGDIPIALLCATILFPAILSRRRRIRELL